MFYHTNQIQSKSLKFIHSPYITYIMKILSSVISLYDVIDLTYNGEVVFTGTLDECSQFIEEQGSIGYEIVNHYKLY